MLTPQERARLAAVKPVEPEAYEAFLKGRHYWYRRSPGALAKSIEYFDRATAKHPTYALAHAGLADSLNSLGWDLFGGCRRRMPSQSAPVRTESARFGPGFAEAHAALGWAATAYDWDWDAAERAIRRAIELKPQYGPVHIWYSHFLHAMRRIGESSAEARRAIECDALGLITRPGSSILASVWRGFSWAKRTSKWRSFKKRFRSSKKR